VHQPEVEPNRPRGGGQSTLLDRVLSGAAMFVALSSLAIALYEAHMTREHDRLSVWPYVSTFHSDSGGVYTFNVRNVGLGPALVRSFQVRVDGTPRANWGEVAETLIGTDSAFTSGHTPNAYSSFGRGTVLLPGARLALLQLGPGPAAAPFHRAAQRRMDARICYCSLYGDCWVLDTRGAGEPEEVRECPAVRPSSDLAL